MSQVARVTACTTIRLNSGIMDDCVLCPLSSPFIVYFIPYESVGCREIRMCPQSSKYNHSHALCNIMFSTKKLEIRLIEHIMIR